MKGKQTLTKDAHDHEGDDAHLERSTMLWISPAISVIFFQAVAAISDSVCPVPTWREDMPHTSI